MSKALAKSYCTATYCYDAAVKANNTGQHAQQVPWSTAEGPAVATAAAEHRGNRAHVVAEVNTRITAKKHCKGIHPVVAKPVRVLCTSVVMFVEQCLNWVVTETATALACGGPNTMAAVPLLLLLSWRTVDTCTAA